MRRCSALFPHVRCCIRERDPRHVFHPRRDSTEKIFQFFPILKGREAHRSRRRSQISSCEKAKILSCGCSPMWAAVTDVRSTKKVTNSADSSPPPLDQNAATVNFGSQFFSRSAPPHSIRLSSMSGCGGIPIMTVLVMSFPTHRRHAIQNYEELAHRP